MTVTVSVGNAVIPSGVFCWMRFRQAAIAGTSRPRGPHQVGDSPLNPGADMHLDLKSRGIGFMTTGLQEDMMAADPKVASAGFVGA